ncbi:MAG TPA: hypothetical protein V6D00_05640 [Pantanalinema sp.]
MKSNLRQRRVASMLLAGLAIALLATSCSPADELGTVATPQQSAGTNPSPTPSDLTGNIVED